MSVLNKLSLDFSLRKHKSFSQGESFLVSLARSLSHWSSQVRLLVIDEGEQFLDSENRKLFNRIVANLSQSVACYWVSHDH
jgi:ABC-type molybdenum transport system ATPase subunit/photorepair protein PhrA